MAGEGWEQSSTCCQMGDPGLGLHKGHAVPMGTLVLPILMPSPGDAVAQQDTSGRGLGTMGFCEWQVHVTHVFQPGVPFLFPAHQNGVKSHPGRDKR